MSYTLFGDIVTLVCAVESLKDESSTESEAISEALVDVLAAHQRKYCWQLIGNSVFILP